MKLKYFVLAVLAAVVAGWWIATAPADYIKIAPPYEALLAEGPSAVRAASTADDWIAGAVETRGDSLPGYDEVVPLEEQGRALATGMDGWIWTVELATGKAERLVDAPLSAAGARRDPSDPNLVYFCSARLYGMEYPAGEVPGVYRLDLRDNRIAPIALYAPVGNPAGEEGEGRVFVPGRDAPAVAIDGAGDPNARPVAFCNDLDVSRDGRRIYFSEPFAYEGASMGRGAFREAISLGRNGRLYMVDLDARKVALVAQDFVFIDGVLLEYGAGGARETSVLITETVKFALQRFYLSGPRAGQSAELWHSLPGLPDGLDRDAAGRIWIGVVKRRTPVITFAHKHPWLKQLILRLPHALLPVPHETGLMALSPDASRVLLNTIHDGSRIQDISVVVPGRNRLYPAAFLKEQRGFHVLPYPEL